MIRFTIVTVTYNAAGCVDRTIQSVLGQTYPEVEYIIVDGGSNDGTVDRIKNFKGISKWISEPDKGIYDGMNKGIGMATGDYLLFMNADDVFASSDTLSKVAEQIKDKDSLPDVIYGSWLVETEHGNYHQEPGDIDLLDRKWVICHQATLVKVSVLKDKLFDLGYHLCADFNQLSSLYIEGRSFLYIPIEIAHVPIVSGASFDNFAKSKREHYKIISQRGLGSRLKTEIMIMRIGCVHFLKWILPKRVSDWFFGLLARYYKVM